MALSLNLISSVARHAAVRRGMRWMQGILQDPDMMNELSPGPLYCTGFMADTAACPEIRRESAALARHLFRQWRAENPLPAENVRMTWLEVEHWSRQVTGAQRAGLRLPRVKARLALAARRTRRDTGSGFDPRRGPPPSESVWCHGLTGAWCLEQAGLRGGASYAAWLRWLPWMRPWAAATGRRRAHFLDAAYAVTHVVYTLNDYGRYLLRPEWLPYEYAFLYRSLSAAVAMENPDLTGECCDTLRSFGLAEDDPQLLAGREFLMGSQNADGSWGDPAVLDYIRFHATWAAMDGLRDFRWRGFGLSNPSLLPMLRRSAPFERRHFLPRNAATVSA